LERLKDPYTDDKHKGHGQWQNAHCQHPVEGLGKAAPDRRVSIHQQTSHLGKRLDSGFLEKNLNLELKSGRNRIPRTIVTQTCERPSADWVPGSEACVGQ
jgi:hypothetical protein